MPAALRLVAVQPDFFCRWDAKANVGAPFCQRCGCGISRPTGQLPSAIFWCYGCGWETDTLPMEELPIGWSEFDGAVTFHEAQRMRSPGFNPVTEMDCR
jgi:hypothetical protein